MTAIGTPATHIFTSGDQAEVVRLGEAIGLGIATGDGAAMGTLTPAEARRLGEELIRQAG